MPFKHHYLVWLVFLMEWRTTDKNIRGFKKKKKQFDKFPINWHLLVFQTSNKPFILITTSNYISFSFSFNICLVLFFRITLLIAWYLIYWRLQEHTLNPLTRMNVRGSKAYSPQNLFGPKNPFWNRNFAILG